MLVTQIRFLRDHNGHNAGVIVPYLNKAAAAALCRQGIAVLVAENVDEAPAPVPVMPEITEAVQIWREANGFPRAPAAERANAPQKPAQAATPAVPNAPPVVAAPVAPARVAKRG